MMITRPASVGPELGVSWITAWCQELKPDAVKPQWTPPGVPFHYYSMSGLAQASPYKHSPSLAVGYRTFTSWFDPNWRVYSSDLRPPAPLKPVSGVHLDGQRRRGCISFGVKKGHPPSEPNPPTNLSGVSVVRGVWFRWGYANLARTPAPPSQTNVI